MTESTAAMSDLVIGGHSGDEAMAPLAGPHTYAPTWFDGRDEELTLSLEAMGDTVTVHDSPVAGRELGERLTFDASVHLVSEHGTVEEQFTWRVVWDAPFDVQDLGFVIPAGDVGGSLDPATIDPAATDLAGSLRVGSGPAASPPAPAASEAAPLRVSWRRGLTGRYSASRIRAIAEVRRARRDSSASRIPSKADRAVSRSSLTTT